MLEVGNGGLTEAEERAHFGLWAISKSPLILGCDLTKIPSTTLAIISNKGVIGISQDSLGKAATTFQPSGQPAPVSNALYPYWAGKLSDGVVIGLVAANGAATLSVNFADVPGLGDGSYSWTELYGGTSGTGTSVSATLAAHDMVRDNEIPRRRGSLKSLLTMCKAIFKVGTSGSSSGPTSTKPTPTTSHTTSTTAKAPTTTKAATSTTVVSKTTTASSTPTGTVAKYGQCGGISYTGPTICIAGTTCTVENDCQ